MEEEGFLEDDLFWKNLNYEYKEYEEYFINNFEIGDSWSRKIKIFGDNDINCIKVFIENGFIASISCRVNFKTDYSRFLNEVIKFCELNDFLVVDNELNTLSLDFEAINENIMNSKAHKKFRNFFDDSSD